MKNLKHTLLFVLLATFFLVSCRHHESETSDNTEILSKMDSVPTPQKPPSYPYKAAIITLMQQDSATEALNHGDFTAVASGMRQLDLSQCPRNFATAYVDHIHAWHLMAEIQQALSQLSSDDTQKKAFVKSVIEKALGADHTALDDIEDQEKELKDAQTKAHDQVRTTFNEVERIAVGYGVQLH